MINLKKLRRRILTLPREETVRQEVLNMRPDERSSGIFKDQKKDGIFHLEQDAGGIV